MLVGYIVIDIALGTALFFVVNALGQYGLSRLYSDAYGYGNSTENLFNMGYRVLAPVVLLLVVLIAISFVNPGEDLSWTLPSIYVYWLERFVSRFILRNLQRGTVFLLIFQATVSIVVCHYMYTIAISDPVGELLPKSSDISIEFVALVLLVLFQIMAQSPYLRKRNYRGDLKANCEKFLFWFSEEFAELLPRRYQEDTVLKALLYSFALAEDHYRPKSVRRVETALFKMGLGKLGLVKTTGIMQVRADKALSDAESVERALLIIEEIYDEYLSKSSSSGIVADVRSRQSNAPILMWGKNSYSYQLQAMLGDAAQNVNGLYGKYNGSNLTKARFFFNCACEFIRDTQYEHANRTVVVHYRPKCAEYENLPAGEWARIGRGEGFACAGDCHCKAYSIPSFNWRSSLDAFIADERLNGTFSLACQLGDNATILVSAFREEAITILENEYGLQSVKECDYSFLTAYSNLRFFVSDARGGAMG